MGWELESISEAPPDSLELALSDIWSYPLARSPLSWVAWKSLRYQWGYSWPCSQKTWKNGFSSSFPAVISLLAFHAFLPLHSTRFGYYIISSLHFLIYFPLFFVNCASHLRKCLWQRQTVYISYLEMFCKCGNVLGNWVKNTIYFPTSKKTLFL